MAFSLLWWRLNSGPIDLDLATPWLTAAIEENFGSQHKVYVGGTQLERDEAGRTSLRIRDIAVRDRDGNVVVSAPKARITSYNVCYTKLLRMGHNVKTFIGVHKRDLVKTIRRIASPDYMPMSTAGMADMAEMEMPLPDNTLPMMTGFA